MSGRDRAAARITAATPPDRDRVIDLVRVASLLVVVVGHWMMADVCFIGGRVSASNALSVLPALHPVTWLLQVIPLFFVAGGYANVTVWRRTRARGASYREYLRGRVVRLLRPVLVFAVVSQFALGVAWVAGMRADDVEFLARLLGRPLWFLVVYLLVTALAPLMVAWHERSPAAALTTLAAAATAVDLVRVMAGAEEAAYLNFLLVWLFAQQLGFLYADGRLGLISPPAFWAVVAGTVVVLTVVTTAGPYPVSMIGMPGEMSNMAPPSVCLVLLAVGQTALVMLARRRLSGWLARPGVWAAVVAVGGRAMTVYLWHLTVLAAVVGLTLALRIGMPAAGTTSWWLSRPLWLSALALVLLPIVASMARLEKWWPIDHGRQHGGSRSRQASSGAEPGVGMLVAAVFVWVALLGYATAGLEPFGAIGGRLFGLHTGWLPSSIFLIGGWSAVMFRVRVAAPDTNGS